MTASALSTPPTQAMLALSPIAIEFPMSAETLGVTMQVRSPTVIAFALTAVTVPSAETRARPSRSRSSFR